MYVWLHTWPAVPLGEEPSILSGKECGYAIELVLGAVQKRKILGCDGRWFSIMVPSFGDACFLHIPPHLYSLQLAMWKNWVLCNRKMG
jgi:hypothetical protein